MTSQQGRSGGGIWSDLDLNGETPVRVRPDVGDWGPKLLPSTRQKQRLRRWVPVLAVVILTVLVAVGWVFYLQVR
ncbi:hypothetical protein [Propioniferax innocua]|uniref:Uncharacterized protein n=1 Tax=Propioniferax innocua TaxID=1753 RepID=A0A542ZQ28_9ACTN|nr:hypothetical protein [Propioniferax innocua]TQL62471.1 hypothetical protein FB460_0248 [Propioniferax innocua]